MTHSPTLQLSPARTRDSKGSSGKSNCALSATGCCTARPIGDCKNKHIIPQFVPISRWILIPHACYRHCYTPIKLQC